VLPDETRAELAEARRSTHGFDSRRTTLHQAQSYVSHDGQWNESACLHAVKENCRSSLYVRTARTGVGVATSHSRLNIPRIPSRLVVDRY